MHFFQNLIKYSTLLIFTGNQVHSLITESSPEGNYYSEGDLVWEENFNVLNLSVWDYEANMNGGWNGEFQVYDRNASNSYVKNGILFIKPTLLIDNFGGNLEKLYNGKYSVSRCTDPPNNNACYKQAKYPHILPPIQSARLRTKGRFSFKYGKVEVKAKIPSGDWIWPAIWMLPEENVYGSWPSSGECDIMESRGNRKLLDNKGINKNTIL